MLSLTKAGAPQAVQVCGAFYAIHTDFRYWIRFSQMLKEKTLLSSFDFLYAGEKPEDRQAGFDALLEFYLDRKELPRVRGETDGTRAFDYRIDADLIFAAFYKAYGIDLAEEKLHWHKFRALFDGLHGTRLNEIMGYRMFKANDKMDYKNALQELKEMWELPEEITEEEQKIMDDFDARLRGYDKRRT